MNGYNDSLADVLRSTVHDAQDLIRGEIALARAELREEVTRLRTGAIALSAAAVAAVIALVFVLTAVAWAVPAAFGWPVWSGFALVGLTLAIVAGVLGWMGRRRLNGERHMRLTVDTMKENLRWMRAQRS